MGTLSSIVAPGGISTLNSVETLTNKTLVSPQITTSMTATVGAYTALKVGVTGLVSIGGEAGSADSRLTITNGGAVGLEFSQTAIAGQNRILSYNRLGAAFVPLSLAASEVRFNISGTDRLMLDASGNFGLGRTPNYKVDAYLPGSGSPAVAASNDSMVTVMQSVGTSQANVGTLTSHPVVFITANTERARIDTSGNLLVNATAPDAGYGKQVKVDDTDYPALVLRSTRATNGRTYLFGLDNTTFAPSVFKLRESTTVGDIFVFNPQDLSFVFRAGAFGYGAGAGGTVTQATSKSTAVTLNKPNGVITLNGAALAAGATVGFQLNNSFIGENDSVVVNLWSTTATLERYRVFVDRVAFGYAWIVVQNYSGGSLSEVFTIKFTVIKGSTT